MENVAATSGHEGTGTKAPSKISPWVRVLQVFAVLWACVCIVQDIDTLAYNAHLERDAGTIGINYDSGGKKIPGYVGVTAVAPGSPAAKAGIVPGDQIHYNHPEELTRRDLVGYRVGLEVEHQGQHRHVGLVAAARFKPEPLTWSFLTDDKGVAASSLLIVFIGGFIALRSRGNLTTLMLAFGLITYGLAAVIPPHMPYDGVFYFLALFANNITLVSIPFFFYAFALNFYKDTIAAPKRWEYGLLATYAIGLAVLDSAVFWYLLTASLVPVLGNGFKVLIFVSLVGFLLAFVYLFLGWRRSRADLQQRYAILLIAVLLIIISQTLLDLVVFFKEDIADSVSTALVIGASILGGVVAPPLFAYAILRHKVLDLGFAFNRTLVYTMISFVILLLFGLAEWGIDKVMPHAWHEQVEANAFISAAIALCIFLVFHRIRDFVEHHVETLFFRQWHHKEAELRRFVREASFILKREPLITTYVEAVRTFCDGTEVALYLANTDGVYQRAEGHLGGQPDTLDADNPFLVSVRANRTPFEPGAAIALVLPMIHRTEVIGATLVGLKPNGFNYRPDEKEVLAWAAHQVGLDLHALEVERLQKANAELAATNTLLTSKYSDLRDMTEGLLKV